MYLDLARWFGDLEVTVAVRSYNAGFGAVDLDGLAVPVVVQERRRGVVPWITGGWSWEACCRVSSSIGLWVRIGGRTAQE